VRKWSEKRAEDRIDAREWIRDFVSWNRKMWTSGSYLAAPRFKTCDSSDPRSMPDVRIFARARGERSSGIVSPRFQRAEMPNDSSSLDVLRLHPRWRKYPRKKYIADRITERGMINSRRVYAVSEMNDREFFQLVLAR